MTRNIVMQRWCIYLHSRVKIQACCLYPQRRWNSSFILPANFTSAYTNKVPSIHCGVSHLLKVPVWRTTSVQKMCSVGSDSDVDETDAFDRELKDIMENFRQSLYPNSQDPLIIQLNQINSVQGVFNFVFKNQDILNGSHISQAVLVLWELQRVYWQVCIDRNPEDNLSDLKQYVSAVRGHPDFHNILRLVTKYVDELSPDALTCTLLYLVKMGVSRMNPTAAALLARCEKEAPTFQLSALSRFLVAVHGGYLWTIATNKPLVPVVLKHLMECDEAEQFRLVTICLHNVHHYITPDILNLFKSRVRYLIRTGVIGSHCPRTIVKIISLLDFPRWSMINSSLIKELMHCLCDQISSMKIADTIIVHRVFQSQLEPVSLVEEIQNFTLRILENRDAASLPVDVLGCVVPFSPASTREKVFESVLVSHIQSPSFHITMPSIYKILRYLKTSNLQLCDLFWSKVLDFLKSSDREDYKLLSVCHKYMHFNNNLGGTYRHYEFEDQMIEWLVEELHKTAGVVPTKVARISSFVLGYGKHYVPQILINKIQEMSCQFSILDCLNVSRGLQIATELRSRFKNARFVDQLMAVSSVVSSCTRSHLASSNQTLPEINMLMRAYFNMRGISGTDLFDMLSNKYSSVDSLMNSRLIRDVTFNLIPQRCYIPDIIEHMVDYVLKSSDDMLGDTIEKLLYYCYWVGYIPKSEQFPQVAADVILRDREKMTGLTILQASLSLCFLQHLPTALIHFIFTVDFLERIDGELKLCYSKATYPARVRQYLMELNRAVCLDYPQADVPWFHKKYCEEQATLDAMPNSIFSHEVLNTLASVVGGQEFIKRSNYSPYFYKLDFEVILDENQRPLPVKQHQKLDDRQVTRVAIILLRNDAFSTGIIQLRGPALLRRRHLEILNYRQVEVSQSLWQAMYMTEEVDRRAFLTKLIWPNSSPEEASDTDTAVPVL